MSDAAYPYLWSQQSGGWWGKHPIPCRIVRDEGMKVKIAALRPDGVELERFVKKERLRRAGPPPPSERPRLGEGDPRSYEISVVIGPCDLADVEAVTEAMLKAAAPFGVGAVAATSVYVEEEDE